MVIQKRKNLTKTIYIFLKSSCINLSMLEEIHPQVHASIRNNHPPSILFFLWGHLIMGSNTFV